MLIKSDDIRALHRRAVLQSIDVVNAVTPEDFGRPTPCGEWTLLDLLAHMTVQHRGFAAAARGAGAHLQHWNVDTVVDAVRANHARAHADAGLDVLDAFAADGMTEAAFELPEFGEGAAFPGVMAMGFHFVDYVVHGWDVAASLGLCYELSADIIAAALPLVLAVPEGEIRSGESAPFAPAIEAAGGDDFDRILRHLGRRPDWAERRSVPRC
jgi:uncharacterized protein (TIGR03086 family)